ncbi:hypothetical protein DV515_00013872 [Chloebia gouldiae]|uniref:Uncharacterized protein n=1 Tax=Chloebia gouldiae TaxID=44316 RepID=A0A3L8RZU4_CHLGU|nr:hypothetical protein DV515_00013872 [Chloebia gouldiae]
MNVTLPSSTERGECVYLTGKPASLRDLAVPPEAIKPRPSAFRLFANSTRLVLSETLSKAGRREEHECSGFNGGTEKTTGLSENTDRSFTYGKSSGRASTRAEAKDAFTESEQGEARKYILLISTVSLEDAVCQALGLSFSSLPETTVLQALIYAPYSILWDCLLQKSPGGLECPISDAAQQ